ncbi:MAG: putative Ig domain-containing protein [Blastocatellia bacterium]|nr:putative Ig domain-containing protein [Blastocatellia bacterium]
MRSPIRPFFIVFVLLLGGSFLMRLSQADSTPRPAASATPLAAARQLGLGIWREATPGERLTLLQKKTATPLPAGARMLRLDRQALKRDLGQIPLEFSSAAKTHPVVMEFPLPDGKNGRFRIEESPTMEPALAAKFPEIKSFRGIAVDGTRAYLRFDWSYRGFHAMLVTNGVEVQIQPAAPDNQEFYQCAYAKDFPSNRESSCLTTRMTRALAEREAESPQTPTAEDVALGSVRRNYRLAVAATQEFYNGPGGGSQISALSLINSYVNNVNVLFEHELSVHFNLIGNNDQILFTAEPDGYTNNQPPLMLDENRIKLQTVIGAANYDVGHVFGLETPAVTSTGIAYTGVACRDNDPGDGKGPVKAAGVVTLTSNQNLDPITSALFAHELAHQFGATHSFNDSADLREQRVGATAYESGYGATIMSYARNGVHTISPVREPRFHSGNYTQLSEYITKVATCATTTNTGNNPPTVSAGPNYVIPRNTPFILTANGTDPDVADIPMLAYCWEELDAGGLNFASPPYSDVNDPANTTRPIFRPFPPVAQNFRFFPSLQFILDNNNVPPPTLFEQQTAENLPNVARTMNFRCTIRDISGGISNSTTQVTVAPTAGPFMVTSQNSFVSWAGNSTQTVTWNVANTNQPPINCTMVRISLTTGNSSDAGGTFPIVLADNVPNTGTANVIAPNVAAASARIKVEAVGNIFFDINSSPFEITTASQCPELRFSPASLPPASGAYNQQLSVSPATGAVTFTALDPLPAGLTLSSGGLLSGTPTAGGTFRVQATDQSPCSAIQTYRLVVCGSITLTPNPLPDGTVGSDYTTQLTASGGTGPYSFAVTVGTLPANLVLATNGLFSGAPQSTGSFSFTIRATDANGCTGSQAYTLNVGAAAERFASIASRVSGAERGGEGRAGNILSFPVMLSAPSATPVTVDFATDTVPGGAVPGQDFIAENGTVTFAPGETLKYVDVIVMDNDSSEGEETFEVDLSNPVNAILGNATAIGDILDDDFLNVASGITVQQGTNSTGTTIATVVNTTDLTGIHASVLSAPNGVNLTNFQNTNGTITANIQIDCTVPVGPATIDLYYTDDEDIENVVDITIQINANTPPGIGAYTQTGVPFGGGATATPASGPTDNGGTPTLAIDIPGFTGTSSINQNTGVVTLGNGGPGGNFTATVTATDNCGSITTRTFTVSVSNPPQITAGGTVNVQAGANGAGATIATVSDVETAAGSLVVTANPPAGLTVTNIVNTNGTVTATVTALCNATTGANTVVLTVTDGSAISINANLSVMVTANSPPQVGTYANSSVQGGGGTTITSTPPTDNVSVASLTANAPGFTGTITGNTGTGTLTVTNAAPPGVFTVTVTATDNCGATATTTFQLTVINGPPTIQPAGAINRQQGTAGSVSTVATVTDDSGNGTVTVTATSVPAGLTVTGITNTNGTVTATIAALCNATVGNNTVVLTATDINNSTGTLNLTVNVMANGGPTLTYTSATVASGSGRTINPASGPSDNGSVANIIVFSPGTFAGTVSVNSGTGVVTVGNAAPVGTHTITIRATDNCGAITDATLTLTVTGAASHTVTQFYPVASTSGKTITIAGTGFVAGNTQVFFGDERLIPATVNTVTPTTISVVVPASSTGAGNVNGYITVRVNGADVTTSGLTPNAPDPSNPAAVFPEFILWGDVTRDGQFATNDVALARAFLQFQATPTSRQMLAVDVIPANGNGSRGNGQLTTTDFTFLRAVSFGQAVF